MDRKTDLTDTWLEKEKEFQARITEYKSDCSRAQADALATQLIPAVESNSLANVKSVMKRVWLHQRKKFINSLDEGGLGALHIAAGFGYVEIVAHLLDNEGSPVFRDIDGHTAIHWACRYVRNPNHPNNPDNPDNPDNCNVLGDVEKRGQST